MTDGKHIRFVEGPPNPKTKVWSVHAKEDGFILGSVSWFGRWRCYAFFPTPDTVFERTCLRDIANFCDAQTSGHRKARET